MEWHPSREDVKSNAAGGTLTFCDSVRTSTDVYFNLLDPELSNYTHLLLETKIAT